MRCDLRKNPTCDFAWLRSMRPKEAWERNHAHLSLCPLIHKWLRLSLFLSASGHGLSVMTLSINLGRQSVSWVALSPAVAALVFITVSVRDRDKLRPLRAVKGSFHRQGFLSPVCSAHLLSIIRP